MKAPVLKRIEEITAKFDPDTLQPKIEADIQSFTDDRANQACREFGSVASATGTEEDIYDNLDDTNFTLSDNQCDESVSFEPPSRVRQQQPSNSSHQPGTLSSPAKNLRKPKMIVQRRHSPFGVAVNSKRQMTVTDSGKHRVLVMTSTGQKIFSFGKRGSGKGQFKQPCGVAVDNDNCIYVTDNNNLAFRNSLQMVGLLQLLVDVAMADINLFIQFLFVSTKFNQTNIFMCVISLTTEYKCLPLT